MLLVRSRVGSPSLADPPDHPENEGADQRPHPPWGQVAPWPVPTAFGPATTADLTAWCRLTGIKEVVDRIRDRLRPFRDERGRELLDVPDAPRPDPDTRVPVRFLPECDNVLLSHADRRRFTPDERRAVPHAPSAIHGTVLHDGRVSATWRLEHDRGAGTANLHVDPMTRLTARAASSVEAEGRRLLGFLLPDLNESEVLVHRA